MKKCMLCPRGCNVDRENIVGFCGEKGMKIAHAMLHKWEEPIISGKNGSGAIFFSGCNMKCVYCQNYELSRGKIGKYSTKEEFIELIKNLEKAGAHNINLVTPTHFVREIKSALTEYKPTVPIVYNSSGYETEETIKSLENIVDVYLMDFKYYGNDEAVKYSSAPNYFEYASNAILKIKNIVGEDRIENGLIKKGLIIRILILPGLSSGAIKILDWIKENLGTKTIISIMNQYIPLGEAKNYPEINKKVSPIEYKRVVNHALNLGFCNAFIQEDCSASEVYVPEFKKEKLFGF